MADKRGALELSVNTIVIIVIGVTLLTLGLVFVKSIFSQISDISDTTFDKANSLLGNLENVDSLLTIVPSQIEVEKGKDEAVKIIIANIKPDVGTLTINALKVTPQEGDKLDCFTYEGSGSTPTKSTGSFNIASGSQKEIVLLVKDKGGDIRTSSCRVEIEGPDLVGEDTVRTVVVRIVPGQGLFGG